MTPTNERPSVGELRNDLTALRGNWLWFVLLGIAALSFWGLLLWGRS